VAIIHRQLPFEYTIASRSIDVMMIIPLALVIGSTNEAFEKWNKIYDDHNKELKSIFEKQAEVERNYNMHNMGKTVGELHVLHIEYEKGLPKKATTPYVWGCEALVKRDTPDNLQQISVKCIFVGYPKETIGYYFYFLPKNKIIVARYTEFLEKNLISQEASRRVVELEEIQDKDTSPSENTNKIPVQVEGYKPPQEEIAFIRRSVRTHQALIRLCLNVEVKEHSLGVLNEPANYKAALLDSESNKWFNAMRE
nr:retrotransposon protein, putative, Ty1-copia subclass [Tanacetum cinerariifolium]